MDPSDLSNVIGHRRNSERITHRYEIINQL